MSAFVVSAIHVNAIVSYAIDANASFYFANQRTDIGLSNAQEIGAILFQENCRSVNHRYRETDSGDGPAYIFKRFKIPLTPVEAIKLCHCLAYQSNETDDWEETKACRILHEIQEAATRKLPDYDKAPWAID